MTKLKYLFSPFPPKSLKSYLSELSSHELQKNVRIFETFQTYTDDSCEQSPRRILYNMIQNSESIFHLGEPNLCFASMSSPLKELSSSPCASTSSQELLSHGSSMKLLELNSSFSFLSRDQMIEGSSSTLMESSSSSWASTSSREQMSQGSLRTLMEASSCSWASTSSREQMSQESSSTLMESSSSSSASTSGSSSSSKESCFSCLTQEPLSSAYKEKEDSATKLSETKRTAGDGHGSVELSEISSVDRKEDSVPGNLETKITARDGQESTNTSKILSKSAEDISTAKSIEMNINQQDERKEIEKHIEDMQVLIKRNLVEIRSMSVIEQDDSVGVEIDVYLHCVPHGSSKIPEDSSPSEAVNRPNKLDKEVESPSGSLSKRKKSPDVVTFAKKSIPAVDYSDSNIRLVLANRLLSILSYRKEYIAEIQNCYKKFLRDIRYLKRTVENIEFVVRTIPMKDESYVNDDFVKLRTDLTDKMCHMCRILNQLLTNVETDGINIEKCLQDIDIFEEEHGPSLSTRGSIPTLGDIQRIDLRLKEICTTVDWTVILKNGRNSMFLSSSSDYEWLIKNFVKILIITEILEPPFDERSSIGNDE